MTEYGPKPHGNQEIDEVARAVKEGKQSPNWQKYTKAEDLPKVTGIMPDDWPYREGFPHTPRAYNGGLYEVKLWDGEVRITDVDYSTQYRSEGLRWNKTPSPWNVIAWKEYDPPKDTPQ